MEWFRCYIRAVPIILMMIIFITILYFGTEISCITPPAALISSSIGYVYYILISVAAVLIMAMLSTLFSTYTGASRSEHLSKKVIHLLIVLCVLSVPFTLEILQHMTNEVAEKKMFGAIGKYKPNSASAVEMDFIQSSWQCCGVYNIEDWQRNYFFNRSNKTAPALQSLVPPSCRRNKFYEAKWYCTDLLFTRSNKTVKVPIKGIYKKGCMEFMDMFRYSAGYFAVKYALIYTTIAIFFLAIMKLLKKIESDDIECFLIKREESETSSRQAPSNQFSQLLKQQDLDDVD